ncbi:MAG TPA: DUF1810 domain-containing protein [Anditalea sp.]|nr:DUF1810 domain-containing protein [Anditalea sp.]
MANTIDLSRFLIAQEEIYGQVVFELKTGQKRSHWMWFIFPQIKGLGLSSTAKYFALKDIEEARAYYNHPILGGRLLECTKLLNNIENPDVDYIFGYPDNLKLKSSLTLFMEATSDPLFEEALNHYFHGIKDEHTLQILNH